MEQLVSKKSNKRSKTMTLLEDLRQLLGTEKVSINETILLHHSGDESHHAKVEPDVVVFPEATEDVQKVAAYANKHRIPIVPYGVGSGLEGQAIPIKKGISLNFEKMNRI